MTTTGWLGLALLLGSFGCSPKPKFAGDKLPKTLEGGWQLGETKALTPEALPECHSKNVWRAEYNGPRTRHVFICEMPAEASAFELSQKWKTAPGTMTFQHKVLFLIVEADDRGAAPQAFLKALDAALP